MSEDMQACIDERLCSHRRAFDAEAARTRLFATRLEVQTMNSPSIDHSHGLTRRSALWLVAALTVPQPSAFAQSSNILVHKDPN